MIKTAKYTKKAIIESFLNLLEAKSLDKISVKDIIESAEINRNTFYYHYQDIYDLLDKIFEDETNRILEEADPDGCFYDEYLRILSLFQEHRNGIIHLYQSKSRNILTNYLEKVIKNMIGRFVDRASEGTKLSSEGKSYIIHFYTFAFMGATMHWVENGLFDYSNGLVQTISDSFDATIDHMIEAYINGHPKECK